METKDNKGGKLIMKACFTGHRNIHGVYINDLVNVPPAWRIIKERTIEMIRFMYEYKDTTVFISGGALGYDQLAAQCVIHCRDVLGLKITLEMALPFPEFFSRWQQSSRLMLSTLVGWSDSTYLVNVEIGKPDPRPGGKGAVARALQDRNEYMVNKADRVIGMYIPGKVGGTLNCIEYTISKHKSFCTINPDTGNINFFTYSGNETYDQYKFINGQPITNTI